MKKFILSSIVTLTFLTLGFLMLHYELIGYGLSFFVFLPFTLGYILGESTFKSWSFYGLMSSIVLFLIMLLLGGLEGMICVLMSLPIVFAAMFIGILIKRFLRLRKEKRVLPNTLKIVISPFLLFILLGIGEGQFINGKKVIEEVSTEIVLPYSTGQVYDAIKSVDTLDAEKPFLMKLDLPVPQKCILEEEKVGGHRTCYFEGGLIVEEITELERGKILKMDVIDYQLTGRKWLGFKEAIYTFESLKDGNCKMVRTTTYTSELYPRFYWKPLEEWGIQQEHEYVFRNLKQDLINQTKVTQ
ncbi:polyketide cyclase [Limibacter armeniacum]|uniref:polyketide cyclase n=1 Tax=Limibacter armeniacum TaxID=466084 RepID=UPI002FE67E44